MSAATTNQEPPDTLVEILDDLDAPTLRRVRSYTEQRLDELQPSLEELIRSEAAGEIVDIEDRRGYTLVKMYPPFRDDCRASSRPLILYRVKHETRSNGDRTLQWSYLGEVTDRSSVEGENCGSLSPSHGTGSPHSGEARARDEER